MNPFWLKVLGYDAAGLPEGASCRLVLTHPPHSWLVFLLLGLMAAMVWGVFRLYRRELETCPPGIRRLLAAVRALMLVALVLVMLGPALEVTTEQVNQPCVGILVDRSLSMSLVDRQADPATLSAVGLDRQAWRNAPLSRIQLAQRLLAKDDYRLLKQLRRVHHVKVMTFDSQVDDLATFAVRPPQRQASPTARRHAAGMLPYNLAWWIGAPVLGLSVLAVLLLVGRPVLAAVTVGLLVLAGMAGALAIAHWSEPGRPVPDRVEPAGRLATDASPDVPVRLPAVGMEGPGVLATDLAGAISGALTLQARHPLSGLVMLTDGQATAGEDPLVAAEQAGRQAVPIFPVALGNPAEPQNLRVVQMWCPDSVFTNNPLLINARVQATGCDGQTVRLELLQRPLGQDGQAGQPVVVARRELTIDGDDQVLEGPAVSFSHSPTRPGDYVYTVRLAELPDELVTADNSRSTTVRVLSDQARVLLVSGSPSWEYRNLARLLVRDKTVDVSCWLQSMDLDMRQEGNTVIDHLPRTESELFAYDLVLLLDPDPQAFDPAWMALLKRFLGEHAGGLLYMAGPKYTARLLSHHATADLADLLPVRFGQLSAVDVESLVTTHTRAWPLRLTSLGIDHPLLRLLDDAQDNAALWKAMPGIYWSFPARAAKPASQVLIEHSDPRLRRREGARPLLVVGQFGPGRVLYLGFAGTWRWRRLGEQYFDRFWIQSVRYLIEGRLLGGRKRGRLETDRQVYDVGSRITVTARLYDASYKPLAEPAVQATVRGAAPQPVELTLQAVANRPGYYQGAYTATGAGVHEISLALPGPDGPVRVSHQVTVQVPRAEFADPRLNTAVLQAIAQRSGGRLLRPDQLDDLPTLLPDKTEIRAQADQPASLWDTDRMLITFLLLMTFEWAMRKRYKLM